MISAKFLKDAGRAGLRRLPSEDLQGVAEAAGLRVFAADLSQANTLKEALDSLAAAADFPDWFGHNLDALRDCLTDLSWAPAEGYLIVLKGTASLAYDDAQGYATLLEVLGAVVENWRDFSVPFWVLADDVSLKKLP